MTQEDVIVLWKDANGWDVKGYETTLKDLERFAKLVERRILSMDNPHLRAALDAAQDKARRDEREACAELRNMLHGFDGKGRQEMVDAMNRGLDEYQALIKARGQE